MTLRPIAPTARRSTSLAAALWLLIMAACVPAPAAAAPEAKVEEEGPVASPAAQQKETAPPASREALEVTRKVQARYDQTRSFTADFDQELRVEAGGQILRSSGTVAFERPGKMRWSYEKPEPQLIIADGESLWIYQPEDHQVLKAPLKDAFESRTPVSFLLGVARVEKDFSPTLLSPADDGSIRLRLVPNDDPQGALGTLTLELNPVTSDIRAAIIRDSLGNTTRVGLENLRRNQPVDPSQFRFEVPYGADVIQPTR